MQDNSTYIPSIFKEVNMGGGPSSCYSNGIPTIEQSLPAYHIKNVVVSDEDLVAAKASWDMIMNDLSPEYIRLKAADTEHLIPGSCLTWFYDSFYSRLFEIHPGCKHMFRGSLKAQGKVLCKIIGISIGLRDDPVHIGKVLMTIAKVCMPLFTYFITIF